MRIKQCNDQEYLNILIRSGIQLNLNESLNKSLKTVFNTVRDNFPYGKKPDYFKVSFNFLSIDVSIKPTAFRIIGHGPAHCGVITHRESKHEISALGIKNDEKFSNGIHSFKTSQKTPTKDLVNLTKELEFALASSKSDGWESTLEILEDNNNNIKKRYFGYFIEP